MPSCRAATMRFHEPSFAIWRVKISSYQKTRVWAIRQVTANNIRTASSKAAVSNRFDLAVRA